MLEELQKIISAVPPTQQVAARPAATSGPTAGGVQGITLPNGWNIPAFSAADFAPQYFPITYGDQTFGVDHSTQGRQLGRWNFVGDPSRYGIPNLGNQTSWDFGGDESGIQWIQVKTGDKEGTRIPVRLVDGQYVPQMEGISTVGWDTNDRAQNLALAAIAGGALAGASGLYGGGSSAAPGAAAPSAAAQSFPVAAPGAAITSELPALGAAGGAAGAAGAAGGAASAADIAAMGNVGMGAGGAVVPAAGSTAGGAMNALSSFLSPNVLNTGSNLLSGFLQDRSARRAADAQMAATQAAIDESRRQFDITRSDMEPWRLAGTDSINQLRTALAPGAEFNRSYTWGDIEGDPIFAQTYQTGLAEGTNALRRQLSAAGQRNSGAALKALTRFASDYTNKTGTDALNRWRTGIGDRFNRLSGVAGTGQQTVGQLGQLGANYATNYGNLITSAGNARGASEIARGNAWGGALTNAFNTWQQNRLMDRLLPIG